jgi:hypothetical protein
VKAVAGEADFRVGVDFWQPLFDLGVDFPVMDAMVKVDANDAQLFGENDADASVTWLPGVLDGFLEGKPCG